MFDNLTGLATGLIIFTIVIVVGLIILTNIGKSVASCATGFTYNGNGSSGGVCYNNTDTSATTFSGGTASDNSYTLGTYLGTGSGGLGSWTLAIIALAVGMLFIGALMGKRRY